MRRLLFLGLGGALLFTFGAGPARADNGPHTLSPSGTGFDLIAGSSRCATCHRVHTSLADFPLTADRDDLCLTCHDHTSGGATTNVMDGVSNEGGGTQSGDPGGVRVALRSGGFDYALIGSGLATKEVYRQGSEMLSRNQNIPVLAAGQVTTSKHLINAAADTAWNLSALNPDAGKAATGPCCPSPRAPVSRRPRSA
jgi:predicted CXXCH cytochrome family protein